MFSVIGLPSLRAKSCREPPWLAHPIGTPLPGHERRGVGVAGNHGRHERGVGTAPPGDPVHAPCGVDNSHGVAERTLKALFAPPRRLPAPAPRHAAAPAAPWALACPPCVPPPPAGAACSQAERGTARLGLDRRRKRG